MAEEKSDETRAGSTSKGAAAGSGTGDGGKGGRRTIGGEPWGSYIGPWKALLLGAYLVVVGLALVHSIYQVWPPGGSADPASQSRAVGADRTPAGGQDSVPTAAPDRPGQPEGDAAQEANPGQGGAGATAGPAAGTPGAPVAAGGAGGEARTSGTAQPPGAGPGPSEPGEGPGSGDTVTLLGRFVLEDVTTDLRLLLIVILAGALGSWLHAVSSYAAFLGNRSFVTSWVAWYLVRPVIGSGLALIFYFVLRGGLFTANTRGDDISLYGFAALAGLCGLFTDRATKKLRELFDAMFPTQVEEKDRLEANPVPVPVVDAIEPATLAVGAPDPALVLKGSGFVPGVSQVLVAGRRRTAHNEQSTQLEISLEAGDVEKAGTLEVEVRNPAPGGGTAKQTVQVK